MRPARAGLPMMALCVLASGCSNPSGPSSNSYAGEWSGTTAQGRAVTFMISADEKVTAITLGHEFSGCSGTQTFSNLSLSIAPQVECIPAPCPAPVTSYRAFGYSSGNPLEGASTDLNAVFMSSGSAQGSVNFRAFPGCGSAVGVSWSATRR